MKKILLCLLNFLFLNTLFSNSLIILDVPDYSKMLYEGNSRIQVITDQLGRIVSLTNEDNSEKITINYKEDSSFEIINQENKKKNAGDFSFSFGENQFTITRLFNNSRSVYDFENGMFIEKVNNSNRCYYTYDNKDNSFQCFYNMVTGNDIDTYNIGYSFSPVQISKLKNSNKKINQINASILIYAGYEVIVPFLFEDYENINTRAKQYTASSELIEGKTKFIAENLKKVEGNPWASANGYGLQDKIIIELPTSQMVYLRFYNGFQSDTKKNLYKDNSRAKKIQIKNLNNGVETVISLKDTPDEQIISLRNLCLYQDLYTKLEITILEVYPGEKYKDLCIQAIIPEYSGIVNK